MPIPTEYTFERYLSSKRSVDDRALNRYVWQHLKEQLAQRTDDPVQILEIGAGIGTMAERIQEWGLTDRQVEYKGIDAEESNITAARGRLDAIQSNNFRIELEPINLFDLLAREKNQWDVVIAHAFLDLIDLERWLDPVLKLVKPSGLFYFTINFDGLTILEPEIEYDEQVMRLYHQTMDERIIDGLPSGDSRTGRHLIGRLRNAGASVLAAGSSDWLVHPAYVEDEAYFLHFIVHTIEGALHHHPDIDRQRFAAWIAARHQQIEREELIYIAHQIDVMGTV